MRVHKPDHTIKRSHQQRMANSEGHRTDSVSAQYWQNQMFANEGRLEKSVAGKGQ